LLVGFFRLLSKKAVEVRGLIALACRYVGGWLRQGWAMVAAVYVRVTPAGLQTKLARLAAGIAALSSWMVSNRLSRRLFHSYDRLRNRLTVTGV
jgi:hypothetical protein